MAQAQETEFGRYRLVKRLAVGGMAEIWLARQAGPGGFEKHLVIKRILSHLSADEDFVRMFLDEARLAAHLTHPNIAQTTDFGELDGTYYLAMELVRGPDLKRLMRACKTSKLEIPFRLAARIISQTCAALDYAHKAVDSSGTPLNLIHRDVSPQNILVSLDGVSKLVDFGIARAATQSQHTQSGVVKGKFAYMAPEQIKGEPPLDHRADVYAAGLVLYEMLTGEPGLKGEGQMAILNAIEAKIRPAAEIRPDLPGGLLQVLDTALQKDREKRYPDAGAMESALELFLTQLGKPVSSRDIAEFMKGVQIDSGDPLSVTGTGSFSRPETRLRPEAVAPRSVAPVPSHHDALTINSGISDPEASQATAMFQVNLQEVPEQAPALPETTIRREPEKAPPREALRALPQMGDDETDEPTQTGAASVVVEEPAPKPRKKSQAPSENTLRREAEEDQVALAAARGFPLIPAAIGGAVLLLAGGLFIATRGPSTPAEVKPAPIAKVTPREVEPPPEKVTPPEPPPEKVEPKIAEVEPEPPKKVVPDPVPEKVVPEKVAPEKVAAVEPEPKAKPPPPEPTYRPKVEPVVAKIDPPVRHDPPPVKPLPEPKPKQVAMVTPPLPPPPPIPSAAPGTLTVAAQPWMNISVDGEALGQTPLMKKSLPPGKHKVHLANPESGVTRDLVVEIKSGEDRREMVKAAKSKITFIVAPWGEIRLGEKLLGQTPLPPQELFDGTYQITATNPDSGKKVTRDLVVEAGKDQVVKIDLR